jgi:hypothetical protein
MMSMPNSICFCTMSFTASGSCSAREGLVDRLALRLGDQHLGHVRAAAAASPRGW